MGFFIINLDVRKNSDHKKYIEQDLAARQRDTRNLPITDNYVTPPAYKKRNGKKRALTNTVMKQRLALLNNI